MKKWKWVLACMLLAVNSGLAGEPVKIDFHWNFKQQAAKDLFDKKDYPAAQKALEDLVSTAPNERAKLECLSLAAIALGCQKQYDPALQAARRIPDVPMADYTRMEIMKVNEKHSELIAEFKTADIDHWPESVRGEAFFTRGTDFVRLQDGPAAAADLRKAAEYSHDKHTPGQAWLMLGDTYQSLLKDEQKALEAYCEGVKLVRGGNGYSYTMQAVLSAASILRKQGKYDEALGILGKIDYEKMEGYWGVAFYCAYGETLAGQGKKAEAIAKFNEALGIKDATAADKAACEKRIKELQGKTE